MSDSKKLSLEKSKGANEGPRLNPNPQSSQLSDPFLEYPPFQIVQLLSGLTKYLIVLQNNSHNMMKLLKKRVKSLQDIEPEGSEPISFMLTLGQLEVGRLEIVNDKWRFTYSETFQKQQEFSAITDFPDKNRDYTSEDLWPFFALRIPSLAQPRVKAWAKAQRSEEAVTEAALLKRFGRETAANPFVLSPDRAAL